MITEDYVSFETAKLLMEKGFDEACHTFYDGGERHILKFVPKGVWNNAGVVANKGVCVAPTLQKAMKWLRKDHNLVVNPVGHYVDGRLESWEVDIYFLDCGVDATIDAMGHIYGETYESACENGIEYCLENLI